MYRHHLSIEKWWKIQIYFTSREILSAWQGLTKRLLYDFTNVKSTSVQAMASCFEVPSHFMGQGWLKYNLHMASLCQNELATSKANVWHVVVQQTVLYIILFGYTFICKTYYRWKTSSVSAVVFIAPVESNNLLTFLGLWLIEFYCEWLDLKIVE